MTHDPIRTKADGPVDSTPSFVEHHVSREQGSVYAREYKGADPAFVLMHGFPDNLHIWDDLIPYLTAGGRRVVTFDFLGFGASDKPAGASYSFPQQLADLEAVVEALGLERIVLGSVYVRSRPWLEPAMRRALLREALPGPLALCQILPSALGEEVGNYGAVAVAEYCSGERAAGGA